MSKESFLTRRLDRGALPLVIGDVVAIVVVLSIGAFQHYETGFLLDDPVYLAAIYAPFLIGWAIMAPLVGAYSPGAVESAKASLPLAIRSWIPAALIGVGLRWIGVFHGGADPVFVLVMVVTGSVGIGIWRAAYFKIR
ncbi:DUF3054 domain-containing protein [Halopenitus sp. H-Gu1]|uniref:DUF3054 domain-containing protein n=1 Tax=Halopenitus sp. H-Gu1 TaxID=3242697 RepID=UPI00359E6381